MAEYPALPLFTDAYIADTRHLTTLQHGAYLLLLMTAWRTPDCSLPNDDAYLARIAGMDKRTWLHNKAPVMAFWKINHEQKFQQGRLLDERKYVEDLRIKNSAAGKASAMKRLNRGSTTVQPNSNENSTPTLTPTPTKEKEAKASKKKIIFNREENRFAGITNGMVRRWTEAYPGVDIEHELGAMEQWLSVNPQRKGEGGFVVNWLNKAYKDLGGRKISRGPGGELFV